MGLSIYDYIDYRAFLDGWLNEKSSRSVRGLALRLEISASQISMVRSGRRNLNLEHARHWGWGLRLDDNELDHWEAMVRAAHAPSDHLRRIAERQLQAAQAWQNAVRQSRALDAFSHWYGGVIMQMALLPGFVATGEWIGSRLVPSVDPEEAARTFQLLLDTGLLVAQSDGTFKQPNKNMTSGIQVSSQAQAAVTSRAHKAWLNLGVDALNMPSKIRYLARMTVNMDQARLGEVVEVVHRLHVEAAEATRSHDADTVYEIGLAILPRTHPLDRDS